MGKKHHKKDSKKRRHRSRSRSNDSEREVVKEKKRHHKHHHKDRKKEKLKERKRSRSPSSSDDDVVYVPPEKIVKKEKASPPPAPPTSSFKKGPETPPSPSSPPPVRKSTPPVSSQRKSSPSKRGASPPLSSRRPSSPPPRKAASPSRRAPSPPQVSSRRGASPPPSSSSRKSVSLPRKAPSPSPPPPPQSLSKDAPIAKSTNSDSSLSIAETNALRAKLGLKPLKAEVVKTEQDATGEPGEFVHKPAEDLGAKKVSEKLREKLKERKEKREIEKKLAKVKTLADESDEEVDTSKWVLKTRKIHAERMKAEMKAKQLDEMDEVFGIGDLVNEEVKKEKSKAYTADSIKGLTVEHDVTSFAEGKAMILTLKDKGVLDDEEDALVNVNLLDDERYKKNVFNKKQKPYDYNPVDDGDPDFEEESTVLKKYDEEIDGEKKTKFKLGEMNNISKELVKKKLQAKKNMTLESLVLPELKIASDYYTEGELSTKFKKIKKKKKIRKPLKADDLVAGGVTSNSANDLGRRAPKQEKPPDAMDVDGNLSDEYESSFVLPNVENLKVEIDDDDTEVKLALKKAQKLKKKPLESAPAKLPKVEEILSVIKEEPEDDILDPQGGNIVLNSTAEFCRTLGDIPTYGLAGNREEDPNMILDFEKEPKEVKPPVIDTTQERGGWNDAQMDAKVVEIQTVEVPILDAEPNLGSGVAGALQLALSKGYLEKEAINRPSATRFSHLQAQNYSIDDKAHFEDDKFGRRERYMGPSSEFKERDGYKPNIKLDYIDDDGHLLSAKEAFRYLSHKFHGKGPGKNKVEKRMKKSEQEGLMKQMSSTDTPLGTLQMLQQKQKETQSAFVVLSGSKYLNSTSSISKPKLLK